MIASLNVKAELDDVAVLHNVSAILICDAQPQPGMETMQRGPRIFRSL